MIDTIADILTSSATGGIFGGLFAIGKHWLESKQQLALERIKLEREQQDYQNAQAERQHALTMLQAGSQAALAQTEAETDAEIEVSQMDALKAATVAEFANLKTTSGMDNYRGSVRPNLAHWFPAIYSILLFWAFYTYRHTITEELGGALLADLISTLLFTVSSIVMFYFVARPNAPGRRFG